MEQIERVDGGVAVVILNWNGVDHLRQFLPSVVEHTPSWVDIIVADNGSEDKSCEMLREEFAPRVEVVELGRNWGFAEGYNRALSGLPQEVFIPLNSDVEVSEGWVEALLMQFEEGENVAAVGAKILSYRDRRYFEYAGAAGGFIDYFGYPFCRGRFLALCEQDRGQYDTPRDIFWASGAAFAVRAAIFRKVGGFDGDFFAHMEEIDLCWRFQLAGYRVRVAPQSVVYHLGGGTLAANSPRKVMLNHRNNLAMLYKCAPTTQRVVVSLLRPIMDLATAVSYIVAGRFSSAKAVGEAWLEFMAWHAVLGRKRREVRGAVAAESRFIFRGSIILRYLLGKRESPKI